MQKKIFILLSCLSLFPCLIAPVWGSAPFECCDCEHRTPRHISEAIGIQSGQEPPYKVFEDVRSHMDEYEEQLKIWIRFADGRDVEDKVGIAYLAKLYERFCPTPPTEAFHNLTLVNQKIVADFLNWPQPLFKIAAESVGCDFIKTR